MERLSFAFDFSQAKEYIRLNQDIKTMREMLTHYEQTIDEKDRTEKSLNKALDHLYNKTLMYRHYYELRLIHIEQRRQQYSFSLAKRFHDEKIKRVKRIFFSSTRRRNESFFHISESFKSMEIDGRTRMAKTIRKGV